eukprot:1402863-Amphidinium_carterae.1
MQSQGNSDFNWGTAHRCLQQGVVLSSARIKAMLVTTYARCRTNPQQSADNMVTYLCRCPRNARDTADSLIGDSRDADNHV